jgi:hypothetical protein
MTWYLCRRVPHANTHLSFDFLRIQEKNGAAGFCTCITISNLIISGPCMSFANNPRRMSHEARIQQNMKDKMLQSDAHSDQKSDDQLTEMTQRNVDLIWSDLIWFEPRWHDMRFMNIDSIHESTQWNNASDTRDLGEHSDSRVLRTSNLDWHRISADHRDQTNWNSTNHRFVRLCAMRQADQQWLTWHIS